MHGFKQLLNRSSCIITIAALMAACPIDVTARTLWVDAKSTAADENGSPSAPFRSIGAAIVGVQPGDEIIIREGTYRERFRIPSGVPGRPITVRTADGERVVVTACGQVGGWEPIGNGVWTTTTDRKPDRLFVGLRPQSIAREPNEGWWRSVTASDQTITDPQHLRGVPADGFLGEAYVWFQHGNIFGTLPVETLDRESGRMVLGGLNRYQKLTDGDKYYLQNRKTYVDQPGEWSVEPEGDRFRVYFMPESEEDLASVESPSFDRSLVSVRDGSHVRIEGLEIVGSRRMGIEIHGVRDVHVRDCIAYHNAYIGISLREAEASSVAHNIAWRNGNGISVSQSRGVTVEENDVAYNEVDGILVTWKSDDITVRRNCVQHHLLWGHPDNMQVYRNVTNVRFQDNLLLAAGQSLMMEETRDGEFTGNMVVGSGAYMLIFGHGNAGHYRVHNNTLAMAGYGCMSLTWEGYDVRENIFMSGHGSALYGVRGVEGYAADRNVFFGSRRSVNPMIMVTDAGWLRDFDAVRASSGQDENSVYADPRFRNAPLAFRVLDSRRLDECTKDTWYLRNGAEGWRVGDNVEVNFDGVQRRITAVDDAAISVAPGLDENPIKGWLVANWGDNLDFRLDLRLADDSPWTSLSADGGPVGSNVNIRAYMNGDFDDDGERDLPDLPDGLRGK